MAAAKTYSPRFVTETNEAAPWTDCTWASGLMFANMAALGRYPATRAEREALRKSSGDHFGGSNLEDLNRGLVRRYGWGLDQVRLSEGTLLLRLARGHGAVVQGNYGLLPRHFRRWDEDFAGLHAAYVQGHDRGGNYHLDARGVPEDVFWCDPLGRSPPGTPARQAYRGEWMPAAVLRRFLSGLGNQASRFATSVAQGQHRP